jgi:hypothetical protein
MSVGVKLKEKILENPNQFLNQITYSEREHFRACAYNENSFSTFSKKKRFFEGGPP